MQRTLVVVVGLIVVLGANALLQRQASPTHQVALGFLGEKWYRISLAAEHIGYMHNHTYRNAAGQWHFETTTHFLLASNEPVNLFKQLVFEAKPPYRLESARYSSLREGVPSSTTVSLGAEGYSALVQREANENRISLDWDFTLTDFLAVELWLAGEPLERAETSKKSLDFERLRMTQRSFRVAEKNAKGYVLENAAPHAATRTQLNHNLHPTHLRMAGLFDVAESSREAALALNKLRQKTSYLIPVDQRLTNHTDLKRLTLRLHNPAGERAELSYLPDEFVLEHSPVISTGDANEFVGETLPYPISHPSIQAMAQSALASDSQAQIKNLVTLTNAQLQYTENRPAGSVLRALEQGRGECTDFADLFTTLARAVGLPARTVFGLAYKDGSRPAFMFHAWNEVFSDNRWQSVDPTWNQTRVDATHIPLTDDQAAAMLLASAARAIELSVVDTQYF